MLWRAPAAAATALGLTLALSAQSDLPEHLLRLAQIKHRMAENLEHLPNYICFATIERLHRPAGNRPFHPVDTLRLEVAQVGDQELFAWPGEGRLEEKDLRKMVTGGMVATGDFALHARSLFRTNAPTFTYAGEEQSRGRRALRYDYRVSRLLSGYRIRIGGDEAEVPYHGSFWADAQSLELLGLDVIADEIPSELGVSRAVTRIEYAKMRIGNSDFLLPQSAELTLEDRGGSASRNRTQFTHCRHYTAESVVSFDVPAEPSSGAPAEKKITELDLPAGLMLEFKLETQLDSQKSAVGDLLAARLLRDVKQGEKVLLPAGATIAGRIRILEKRAAGSGLDAHYVVGLEFSEIEFEQTHARFLAQLESLGSASGVSRGPPSPRTERERLCHSLVGSACRVRKLRRAAGSCCPLGTFPAWARSRCAATASGFPACTWSGEPGTGNDPRISRISQIPIYPPPAPSRMPGCVMAVRSSRASSSASGMSFFSSTISRTVLPLR